MFILVDDRKIVNQGYESGFAREGISTTGFDSEEFRNWVETVPDSDIASIEAFLLGDCEERRVYSKLIKTRSSAPVIVLNENEGLEQVLQLFAAGVDDVVRKPVHVKEILAKIAAIVRRSIRDETSNLQTGDLTVYFDGRDADVAGRPLPLPRRERRILECLAQNAGRRVSKSQLFSSVYGIFDENVSESVIESHVSKLRKKLRARLGYDPINSKRYLGYCLETPNGSATQGEFSPAQAEDGLLRRH